jgi:hypothetical protein
MVAAAAAASFLGVPAFAQMETRPAQPATGTMPMQGCEPGMGMMCMMGEMPGMMQPGGMVQHAEKKLVRLKADLNPTDAQLPQWNAFADAIRAAAKAMQDRHAAMMPGMGKATLPEQIAMHETMLSEHLERIRQVKGPAAALYATLTGAQKTIADKMMMMMGRMGSQ